MPRSPLPAVIHHVFDDDAARRLLHDDGARGVGERPASLPHRLKEVAEALPASTTIHVLRDATDRITLLLADTEDAYPLGDAFIVDDRGWICRPGADDYHVSLAALLAEEGRTRDGLMTQTAVRDCGETELCWHRAADAVQAVGGTLELHTDGSATYRVINGDGVAIAAHLAGARVVVRADPGSPEVPKTIVLDTDVLSPADAAVVPKIPVTDGQVRVDASRISEHMSVPDLGGEATLGDDAPGAACAQLFRAAVDAGALVVPDGIDAECYGDDDSDGGGFILAAFASGSHRGLGVTRGWHEDANIAVRDGADPTERDAIIAALDFFAAELNAALRPVDDVQRTEVVEVSGGCATVVHQQPGVNVKVVDHDELNACLEAGDTQFVIDTIKRTPELDWADSRYDYPAALKRQAGVQIDD